MACIKNWPKVILFGDSLTQVCFSEAGCWGALLADHLRRKCDVINRGFSGYNTRWCQVMLPEVLKEFNAENIALITIFLGANDSNLPEWTSQHVPSAEFKENMSKMLQSCVNHGIPREKIVLISPPASDDNAWTNFCEAEGRQGFKSNKETERYAQICAQLGQEWGVSTVNFYKDMMSNPNWKEMLSDGLHLSKKGSQRLFELLMPTVDKVLADAQVLFPDWKSLDNNKPESVLQ